MLLVSNDDSITRAFPRTMSDTTDDSFSVDSGDVQRAVVAAAMGNALEWFDFSVYSYMAATIGSVFFPSHSDSAALLAAFAVFAVAFMVRPLGGMFFGPLGDKVGRSEVLVTTIIMMSFGTLASACCRATIRSVSGRRSC